MKASKILLVTTAALAVGVLAMIFTKKQQAKSQRAEVSDEGYELAHDVLYPMKSQRRRHDGYSTTF
jgi:hypothetical protein